MPPSHRKVLGSFPSEYRRDLWWKSGTNISLAVLRSSAVTIAALMIHIRSSQQHRENFQVFWDVKTGPLVWGRHTVSIFTVDHECSWNISHFKRHRFYCIKKPYKTLKSGKIKNIFCFIVLYSVSLCCSVYCLHVNVYCTAATGRQPDCS